MAGTKEVVHRLHRFTSISGARIPRATHGEKGQVSLEILGPEIRVHPCKSVAKILLLSQCPQNLIDCSLQPDKHTACDDVVADVDFA